jgi:hypothetical protein
MSVSKLAGFVFWLGLGTLVAGPAHAAASAVVPIPYNVDIV